MRSMSDARSPRPGSSGTRSRCANSISMPIAACATKSISRCSQARPRTARISTSPISLPSDACEMVRTSTHFKGGVTGAMRIAHLAQSFNMRAEVHGGGMANLAIACAIPNTTWYESLVKTNPVDRRTRDRPGRVHLAAGRAGYWLGVLRGDGLLERIGSINTQRISQRATRNKTYELSCDTSAVVNESPFGRTISKEEIGLCSRYRATEFPFS